MADVGRSALGLSVGATNVAAVTAERALTRRLVLTLFRQRPPEVGVPSENPMLNEPGLVVTDFVDRVGDPDRRRSMRCGSRWAGYPNGRMVDWRWYRTPWQR